MDFGAGSCSVFMEGLIVREANYEASSKLQLPNQSPSNPLLHILYVYQHLPRGAK